MVKMLLAAAELLLVFMMGFRKSATDSDWPEYYGDGARSHYSPLQQIHAGNLDKLEVAWTYASGGANTVNGRTQIQCNPIIINGVLYGVSAGIQAFAVEAASGKEIWKTNLKENGGTLSRGVTYWADGNDKRIFFGAGRWLYALNAATGELIDEFGEQGRIDLKMGIERPGSDEYITANTPNTIFKNLIITSGRLAEGETALLGDVRAFDTRTGKLIWTFHTIPKPGEPGYNTWSPGNPREQLGGANAWMGMAVDRPRGIVYVPTGSAAYDFYGGNRHGDNLYANCLLALDAATGKLLWHYQLVHHDVWDRDPPSPPNLLTITRNGRKVDVVTITTKQGHIFVFDRVSGKPVFPIEEKPFPQDGVAGEKVSPTQPIPSLPVPFTRQAFTEKDLSPFVADKDSLIQVIRKARTGMPYIPLTEKLTIFYPGTDGGAQWGGAATDPEGIMYVPAKEIPVYTTLIPRAEPKAKNAGGNSGKQLYSLYCAACHGTDQKGNHDGSYPSLLQLGNRFKPAQAHEVLQKGRGMMPSFSHISQAERKAIVDFLFDKESAGNVAVSQKLAIPYQHTGYNRWYDRNGYPISSPPWGTLTAVDLNTGQHRWQVPLGEYPELTRKGIPPTGTDNYGGPLVTAGGVVFIAASRDEKIRAFDKETGKVLWESVLPAAGYATPSTYMVNGKQFVVIACGGGKLKTRSGDRYVAFELKSN